MCGWRGCVSVLVVLGGVCFDGFVVNLRNENLHWFYGKKNFIGGGIYVSFNGDVGSRVTFSVFV